MRYVLIFVLLAACAAPSRTPDAADLAPNCGAAKLQSVVGKRISAVNVSDLPQPSRILRPGDAITLDFSPDRLTIDVDTLGLVSSVTCR